MKIEITILGLLMEGNLYGYEIKKKIVTQYEQGIYHQVIAYDLSTRGCLPGIAHAYL